MGSCVSWKVSGGEKKRDVYTQLNTQQKEGGGMLKFNISKNVLRIGVYKN